MATPLAAPLGNVVDEDPLVQDWKHLGDTIYQSARDITCISFLDFNELHNDLEFRIHFLPLPQSLLNAKTAFPFHIPNLALMVFAVRNEVEITYLYYKTSNLPTDLSNWTMGVMQNINFGNRTEMFTYVKDTDNFSKLQ